MGAGQSAPGWFDLGRTKPFPAMYGEWKTPVTADVLEVGWIVAFITLFISFCVILPAANDKIIRFTRVFLFLLLGLIIMLCNFGQEWEVGEVHTHSLYKAGTGDEIVADIGVKLGLRSVNITLKGEAENKSSSLSGETINYNERFTWAWAQGRAGFGPFAGQIQRDYREAQFRGAPYPILWIAEYFTFDGEGIRFGRHYRYAGWYAHICIWSALPMWMLTVILFKMVITYGAIALTITGTLLVIPAIIWAAHRNFLELEIPFEDGVLKTHYGVHWYLSLITGIICSVAGAILYVLADKFHDEMHRFFGNNPLSILDEGVAEEASEPMSPNEMEMARMDGEQKETRLVATFRGRGTSARNWKKSVLLVPTRDRGLTTHDEEEAPVMRQQGANYGTYATDQSSDAPSTSAHHRLPPQVPHLGAANQAYNYGSSPAQQRPAYVESTVYDDLPAAGDTMHDDTRDLIDDEDQPLYENLKSKKLPFVPPIPKRH